jgi:hypothetical protein
MPKPSPPSYPGYFQKYIDQVPEQDLPAAFSNQLPVINSFLSSIPEERSTYAYAAGKWTIKELLQHIIDTERIFNYRALCFARKETASLPGFEENDYAANSNANSRSWQSLVEEFLAVRHATELMFSSFSDEALASSGTSNNNHVTAGSIGFITIGHFYHHKKIIEEKYLEEQLIIKN